MRTHCLAAVVCLLAAAVAGCGKQAPPQAELPPNPFVGLPFVLVPAPDGSLVPRTADGKPLEPSKTPPTEGIKAIRNLSQVAVLTIEGSCYHWVYVTGQWYKVHC